MKGKNLINILKDADVDFVAENVEDSDYRGALHDFFLEKDYEGLSNLISALAKFYVKSGLASSKEYNLLLNKARKDVKNYSKGADEVFGTENVLQNFYKVSLERNFVNEFLDEHNFHTPGEYLVEHPIDF